MEKSSEQQARSAEVVSLQVVELEKARNSMANELVALTTKNNGLIERCEKAEAQCTQLEGMRDHYNTVLEMMGEKCEEVETQREDIQEMKAIFHDQINMLSLQIETLTQKE